MLFAAFPPSVLDENPPHGLSGRSEEMTTTVPLAWLAGANQAQERLVNERCWLKSLAGRLTCHLTFCKSSQLGVHKRQELT